MHHWDISSYVPGIQEPDFIDINSEKILREAWRKVSLILLLIIYSMGNNIIMCACVCVSQHMWRSEDNLVELVLSF